MDVFVSFPDEDIPTHAGENPGKVTPQPFSYPVPSLQLFLQLPYPGLGLLPSRPRSLPHTGQRPGRSGLLAQPAIGNLHQLPAGYEVNKYQSE